VALEILLTGEPTSATCAYELGLVNRVAPDGSALAAAQTLGAQIAGNSPVSVAASKAIADASREWPLGEGFERQRVHTDVVFGSADAREGAAAFLEKRAPKWVGR
jgi:enoyl-CoA hydratase/carnithine racemase